MMSGDSKSSNSPEPEVVDELEPKTKVLDIDYDDIPDSGFPLTPSSSTLRKGKIKKLHVLGDIHGWAPGLINYLISHKLASIEIDGHDLGSSGRLNDVNIRRLFGRNKTMSARELPPAGLSGRPGFMDCVNSGGHGSIKARWIARDDVGFLQIGDIFDRADHSEVAAEILRQLTIDAPNRVFTLVGNHEQFMLEGDYDSWYMNEIRNAVTDSRDTPSEWRGRHLRFMGTVDLESEQRARIVFESYRESTLLLFLTQGAVQQKMLGVDHGLTEEEIDKLLSAGWSSYQAASEIGQRFCTEGVDFPGAFIALVFGDSLFHHGEPDYRKIRLSEMMQWTDDFGWLNYIHGGGYQEYHSFQYSLEQGCIFWIIIWNTKF